MVRLNFCFSEGQSRLDMSLKQQLSRFRNDVESEEILTTGGNVEAAELKRIILELKKIALEMKKNPSLSVLLPRNDTEEEFWRIAYSSDDDIDTKVSLPCFIISFITCRIY